MSENDGRAIIKLTAEQCLERVQAVLGETPYKTPGQLRDAVFNGGPLCHAHCYEYDHPHAEAWRGMENWLFLAGKDWRAVE